MKKIAVLSAGNGGQALAADLALRGHDVALYDLPQFAPVIEAIRRRGNTIELQNRITGTATIRLVTTDIAEALDGAQVSISPRRPMGKRRSSIWPCPRFRMVRLSY